MIDVMSSENCLCLIHSDLVLWMFKSMDVQIYGSWIDLDPL